MALIRKLLVIPALFLLCGPATAADDVHSKLQSVEKQVGASKATADALEQKSKEANQDLETLRRKLIAATDAIGTKEAEQEHLEDRLDELAHDVAVKNAALSGARAKYATLTEALMELSRQPPESLFLETGLTGDYIHRMILMRAILPHMREETDMLAHDLGALDDLKTQLAEQKHLTAAAEKNLQGQRESLDQLIGVRQGYLQQTEEQKEAVARQLVALTSEAKDLHQLLEKLSPRHGGGGAPHGLSSSLKWPVAGRILRPYGMRDADGVTSAGITFTALPGAPVVAPAAGRVVFAGPFRGYGEIVILQHGGGYHSFMAGFGRIDAEMDQDVEAGEPLGVLPVKGKERPELYFEWRHNGEPVDPARGLAGVKKARAAAGQPKSK